MPPSASQNIEAFLKIRSEIEEEGGEFDQMDEMSATRIENICSESSVFSGGNR